MVRARHRVMCVEDYISIGMRTFGEAQNKVMRAYAQSGQYHIIVVEIRDS